ncbi:MAG: type IV pilin protein [Steroidobacter sp.]
MKYRQNFGITLIELMIVVVIIAILAAIAYPSYRQYTIRANRTEAKVALLQVVQGLEKCFTRYHAYDAAACLVVTDFTTQEGNYLIADAARAAMTYTLTATPQAGQVDDARCGTLSIDERGRRTETGTGDVGDCW